MKNVENKIEERSFPNETRKYLGISQVGIKCDAWLWFDFRLATKERKITAREKRLFGRGHIEEIVLVNELIESGYQVTGVTIDKSIIVMFKNVFGIDLPEVEQEGKEYCSGHGKAHTDSELIILDEKYLLECKTMNTKNFVGLRNSRDLQKNKYQYYCQIQGYMHLFNYEKCLFVVTCKENDERLYLWVDYDKKFAKRLFKRAKEIILSNKIPAKITDDRNFYMCRPYICKITGKELPFCPHREVCWNDAPYRKTCRTCQNSELHDHGRWYCKKHKKFLKFKKQLKACKKYESLK